MYVMCASERDSHTHNTLSASERDSHSHDVDAMIVVCYKLIRVMRSKNKDGERD
jgi:hypothetical protein